MTMKCEMFGLSLRKKNKKAQAMKLDSIVQRPYKQWDLSGSSPVGSSRYTAVASRSLSHLLESPILQASFSSLVCSGASASASGRPLPSARLRPSAVVCFGASRAPPRGRAPIRTAAPRAGRHGSYCSGTQPTGAASMWSHGR